MTVERTAPARPAYRDLNVLSWLTAYTASVTGDLVYFLSLTWAATQLAGPSQAGLVIAAGALPRAVLLLFGGVVADRFGPRPVAIVSDATRCVIIFVMASVALVAPLHIWQLAIVAAVFGTVDALFMPAVGAFPPRIAKSGELVRIQGMRLLSIRLSNAVGPVLAGGVLAAFGTGGGFVTSGVLFAASLLLLFTVRVTARPDSAEHTANGRHGLRDGLRYIRGHKALMPLIAVVGLSEMCFSGPVGAGLVLLADERGWSTSGMGWIASAFSIGATGASLLLTVGATIPRAGQTIGLSLLVTAAATAALGNAGTLVAAIVFSGLVGVASGVTMAVTGALVQTVVDPDYLGRVTSVTTLFTLGLSPVLFPAVGFIVDLWGSAVFFTGCGGICLLAAIVALTARAVRDARLSSPAASAQSVT
ncbi:MFS transporter [Dactylosporangium sp. NPDC051485]|uniref:MFS transporter n=1 Tax=Dactylosporangium sp. NPDC051485 TaxID=3154846 RepID=UPI00344727AE